MGARVLVIDDEEAARYGMVRALAGEGYELREAFDGQSALDCLTEFQPDVILSDINMPGVDGITLLRAVKEREDGPLVILITAYGSEKIAIQAIRAGAYDYVAKPYDLDELRNSVRNAVERQRLIHENKRYQEDLRRALTDLTRSQAALVQTKKMSALAELTAGVTHEINTPLGVIQSSMQTLQTGIDKLRATVDEPKPEDLQCRRLLTVIQDSARESHEACRRISRIVSSLVSFAQIDRADFQRFQLNDCVACTVALVRPKLGDDIRLEVSAGNLPEIEGNPRDVNQVILNLLGNAADAIRRRGSTGGSIRVRTGMADGRVSLDVADDGCGIPEDQLSSIFDPGFTTKGVRVGLGVGLAVCFQIVEAHNGEIHAASRAGEGSTFTVVLPLTQPA